MSNGRTELDREGCEFGRQLKKDNDYLKEDVREIKGAKYNEDLTECVCYYPDQLEEGDRVQQITEEEYNSY